MTYQKSIKCPYLSKDFCIRTKRGVGIFWLGNCHGDWAQLFSTSLPVSLFLAHRRSFREWQVGLCAGTLLPAHGLLVCIHWIINLFYQHHCCSQELWPLYPYLELAFAHSRTITGGSLPLIASHRHLHLISRPGARISRLFTATHALLLPCWFGSHLLHTMEGPKRFRLEGVRLFFGVALIRCMGGCRAQEILDWLRPLVHFAAHVSLGTRCETRPLACNSIQTTLGLR